MLMRLIDFFPKVLHLNLNHLLLLLFFYGFMRTDFWGIYKSNH